MKTLHSLWFAIVVLIASKDSTQMTSAPHTYELHENADPAIALFDVTATCDITWTCGSYTCSDSVSCDNCWVENTDNLFYVSGMTVYKKECLKKLCNTCSITDFCATGNTEYTYTVYCDKRNTWIDRPGFTTGTASGTHKLKFKADIDPPFMFNDNFKNSITVGSSIEGDGQKVNQIISNPKNEANDHDTIKFYINDGYRAYWLTVEENTGYVKVSSPLTTETNQIFRTEMCAENRRGLKACQWLNIRVL
ncbi:hypothetical protein DPMN_136933 [Dreissena polymorpha]|uniref:Uncharacterized protein n=1 Tax=Dreissena polymorpha TaxID=45954 RepID=A0A9D4G1P0_DREPO|nr:hypothetical protein DPMN_136933 [Dreissena polymorpha]